MFDGHGESGGIYRREETMETVVYIVEAADW